MVILIAAVGISGSGKTTTIEYLISTLSQEGYRGFAKAGSKITVAISPEEIAIIEKTNASQYNFDKVVKLLENEKIDLIFIEGFHSLISKRPEILKIITAKNSEDLEKTLKETVPPILAITGLIAKNGPQKNNIPYIKMPDEEDALLQIVKKYLKKRK